MKKVFTWVLILSMVLSLSATAFAAELKTTHTAVNSEVGFQITESVDACNRVIRTYQSNTESDQTRPDEDSIVNDCDDYAETKALLLALGMEQDFIDGLSDDKLEKYAASKQMTAVTAYTKTDENGDVTFVSETEAVREAAIINAATKYNGEAVLLAPELQSEIGGSYLSFTEKGISKIKNRISVLAGGTVQTRKNNGNKVFQDSYMRIFFLVSYMGDGYYFYSTTATWLTMPFFRWKDSIGSCAQDCVVNNGTRSGWYSYDETYVNFNQVSNTTRKVTLNSSNYKNAVNGSWDGSAAIVNLPTDSSSNYTSVTYNNFKAYYSYEASVKYPKEVSRFNATATYDHATVRINIDPSISIDLKGNASASIGLEVDIGKESRIVELDEPIDYIPD